MGARRAAIIALVVMGSFVVFMCAGALAVNPTDVSVTATVSSTVQLNMPTTAVDFGGPLEAGQNYQQAITASINSNKNWRLAVTKNRDLTGAVSLEVIPSANLTFETTSADPKVTVKAPAGTQFGTDTVVCEGTRGSGISSTITYSLSVPWDLAPDTYTATHTYTATQP